MILIHFVSINPIKNKSPIVVTNYAGVWCLTPFSTMFVLSWRTVLLVIKSQSNIHIEIYYLYQTLLEEEIKNGQSRDTWKHLAHKIKGENMQNTQK